MMAELKNQVVTTRFPPEASGYLHLGHVKALLLNYLFAKQHNGRIILRFDDTNPEKENDVYEKAILEDIKTLGLECDSITFASDYFDEIIEYAKKLINLNLAYVDFTDSITINELRAGFKPSPYRDTTPDVNLSLFMDMQQGQVTNCCLRAKIDFASRNGCLRDPIIFRIKTCEHPRFGNKYIIYPTYDFACPILDAVQGVTHAMRSVEYKDRDSQYEWFLSKLDLKKDGFPKISDYGKLSFSHTILSKRKLNKLITAGLVSGWSDPRMPTIRGIIRKGIHIEPLLSYIKTQVNSRTVVNLTWDKLFSMNITYLDKISNRLYALEANPIKVKLTGDIPNEIELVNHPKDKSFGTRGMVITQTILVDSVDFVDAKIGTRYTLVGLGNTVINNTNPMTLYYDPTDSDYKNTIKVTWLPDDGTNIIVTVKKFGHLLKNDKPDETEITNSFNKDSLFETSYLVEKTIKDVPPGKVIQIMRKEYCYADQSNSNGIILHVVPTK